MVDAAATRAEAPPFVAKAPERPGRRVGLAAVLFAGAVVGFALTLWWFIVVRDPSMLLVGIPLAVCLVLGGAATLAAGGTVRPARRDPPSRVVLWTLMLATSVGPLLLASYLFVAAQDPSFLILGVLAAVTFSAVAAIGYWSGRRANIVRRT